MSSLLRRALITFALITVLNLAASRSEAVIFVQYKQARNMTAFWDFNGTNPLADRTGNGNNLTFQGVGHSFGPAAAGSNGWTPYELYGAAVPSGDVSRVANVNGGNGFDLPGGIYTGGDFTFITASRRTTTSGFYTLLGSNRFRYQDVNNTLQGAINSPGGSFGGSTPMSVNDWHFIALTYDNTTKQLLSYEVTNGGVLGGPDLVGAAGGVVGLSNVVALRLGNDGLSLIGGPDGFNGQLDFAAFQNGMLSPQQLQFMLDDFVNGAVAVPEPSTFVLLSAGAVALAATVRRRPRTGKASNANRTGETK